VRVRFAAAGKAETAELEKQITGNE
jgi:hypothetical protein